MGATSRPLPSPAIAAPVASDTVVSGPPIAAIDRIKLFSSSEWVDFVLEWVDSLRDQYAEVHRCEGAGDMGRDVIAFDRITRDVWDNYQCKHYDHPLRPSDVWIEFGKLAYYTHQGEYTMPRAYHFVAPQGAGTTLSKLLRSPAPLKQELKRNWEKHCTNKITSTKATPLKGKLLDHVEKMDFAIFSALPPLKLIDGHARTRWHVARFGGGLPPRPAIPTPPEVPDEREAVYIAALWSAYADHLKTAVACLEDLGSRDDLVEHLQDSRVEFFSAESLRAFSRDTLPPNEFEKLQDEVHVGVRDEVRATHADGYARAVAVVKTARALQLTSHALISKVSTRDRGGICHQLANEGKVTWVRRN